MPGVYPRELNLCKASGGGSVYPFVGISVGLGHGTLSTGVCDKGDGFGFPMVSFPFFDGDMPNSPSCGCYVSQLVRFARVCGGLADFGGGNIAITENLLGQGYRFHKLLATFEKFHNIYEHLVLRYDVTRGQLIREGV